MDSTYSHVARAHYRDAPHLEGKSLAGSSVNLALDAAAAVVGVAVGDGGGLERTGRGVVGAAAEGDVADGHVAVLIRVDRGDGGSIAAVLKGGRLDTDLGAHAGVDAGRAEGKVVVVVDVNSAEADRGSARVDVVPVVVGIGHLEIAGILILVAVRVANQRCLIVVVEESVRYSDVVGGVGDIEEAIVVVLAVGHVGREVTVIDPDVGGGLNANSITIGSLDFGDSQVTENNIGLILNIQTNTRKGGARGADDGLVRLDLDLSGTGDSTLDVNNVRARGSSSLSELG